MRYLFFAFIATFVLSNCNRQTHTDNEGSVTYSESVTNEGVSSSDPVEEIPDRSNVDASLQTVLSGLERVQSFQNAFDRVDFTQYFGDGESFTIFAPTDSAFQDFYRKYPNISKDDSKLQMLVLHHIASLYTNIDDMKDAMNFESLQGENIDIRIDGDQVYANEALIVEENISANNGVIHIIDEVMVPTDLTQPQQ